MGEIRRCHEVSNLSLSSCFKVPNDDSNNSEAEEEENDDDFDVEEELEATEAGGLIDSEPPQVPESSEMPEPEEQPEEAE